jgi:hypothetical protein
MVLSELSKVVHWSSVRTQRVVLAVRGDMQLVGGTDAGELVAVQLVTECQSVLRR